MHINIVSRFNVGDIVNFIEEYTGPFPNNKDESVKCILRLNAKIDSISVVVSSSCHFSVVYDFSIRRNLSNGYTYDYFKVQQCNVFNCLDIDKANKKLLHLNNRNLNMNKKCNKRQESLNNSLTQI